MHWHNFGMDGVKTETIEEHLKGGKTEIRQMFMIHGIPLQLFQ